MDWLQSLNSSAYAQQEELNQQLLPPHFPGIRTSVGMRTNNSKIHNIIHCIPSREHSHVRVECSNLTHHMCALVHVHPTTDTCAYHTTTLAIRYLYTVMSGLHGYPRRLLYIHIPVANNAALAGTHMHPCMYAHAHTHTRTHTHANTHAYASTHKSKR